MSAAGEEPEVSSSLVPARGPGDVPLNVAAVITGAIPWFGGPFSAVIGGISAGRKYERVRNVLNGVVEDLHDFKSKAFEEYVRTEDFEELLEKTLNQVAEERSEEKRKLYRAFLTDTIASPAKPYDEQVRFLRTLEEVQPDHLRIIKALSQAPEGGDGIMGSPSNTLSIRLPDISRERIADLVSQLNDLRGIAMTSLNTMMTFHGAQDLQHSILPYGKRLLAYILAD
jgi:hypothetical protein